MLGTNTSVYLGKRTTYDITSAGMHPYCYATIFSLYSAPTDCDSWLTVCSGSSKQWLSIYIRIVCYLTDNCCISENDDVVSVRYQQL